MKNQTELVSAGGTTILVPPHMADEMVKRGFKLKKEKQIKEYKPKKSEVIEDGEV